MSKFFSLWAINGSLDRARLASQLDEMHTLGLDGTVWHPRFYPGEPPYLSDEYMRIVSETILHAKALGLEFWIYDENGWPSGTADGKLLERHPEDAALWLEMSTEPSNPLVELNLPDGRRFLNVRRLAMGIDCLRPEPVRHFLALTHERYREGLVPEAWSYVSAFFSDEPETGASWDDIPILGAVPWTREMPERYRERFGEDLIPRLGELFVPHGDEDFKVRFWEWVTDLFQDGFLKPYREWCEIHGKLFTFHVKGEEHPLFQVPLTGSLSRVLREGTLPGIDALERNIANDYYPRQLVSVAQQFGNGNSMVEAFGGAGWGAEPGDFERYIRWLGGHGITHFVVHLWQYQMDSHAIRDWPASVPNHVGWREAFPLVMSRLRASLDTPQSEVTTLVVSPHRAIMAEYEPWELAQMNIHNASTYADSKAGRTNSAFMDLIGRLGDLHFHTTDERTFEEGDVFDGKLRVGRCGYRHVILPEGCRLTDVGTELVKEFVQSEGSVSNGDEFRVSAEVIAIRGQRENRIPLNVDLEPFESRLPIELKSVGAGAYSACFETDNWSETILALSDRPESLRLNGASLELTGRDDLYVASVPLEAVQATNTLEVCMDGDEEPFVWCEGGFYVRSRSSFQQGDLGVVTTEGPLFMANGPDENSPIFAAAPTVGTCLFELADSVAEGGSLSFEGVKGDTLRVAVDGVDLGFAYGPAWRVDLPCGLAAGEHRLSLVLHPSAFNKYGPHHHLDGDPKVVSPAQYTGRKNFADRVEAPEVTWVSGWNFKPVRMPTHLILST